jgi:hypothetical protein
LRVPVIASLALAASVLAASAEDLKLPRLTRAQADWEAVATDLKSVEALKSTPELAGALARLNKALDASFENIGSSPVPVLLPVDLDAALKDRAADAPKTKLDEKYLYGYQNAVFYAGPGGYDAVIYAAPGKPRDLTGAYFSYPIEIQISGSAVLYELDAPVSIEAKPVRELEAKIPGIERNYLESVMRYGFVRYGVRYVVAVRCHDGGARQRLAACREAHKVAEHLLTRLRVVGGTRQDMPPSVALNTIERPSEVSSVFTYHSPGDLLPGTGMRQHRGRADYTVYSKIRFPIADAPAFANSQSFMHWGNCDQTGRSSMGRRGSTPVYRCRVNGKMLFGDESAPENYSYPWRDNFCEHRYFWIGQCPGGLGHQGQDIRPSWCKQRIEGANRCEPYLHDVVAVRDGVVLRSPGQYALYILVNSQNERVRFRYLHMSPVQFDADGFVDGRRVREGEVIGKVGNYGRNERGTTYHLHFDMQVPTRYGWVFVNPYMTLVTSYERLIRGRGTEIKSDPPVAAVQPALPPTPLPTPAPASLTEPPSTPPAPVPDAIPDNLDIRDQVEPPEQAAEADDARNKSVTATEAEPAQTPDEPKDAEQQEAPPIRSARGTEIPAPAPAPVVAPVTAPTSEVPPEAKIETPPALRDEANDAKAAPANN